MKKNTTTKPILHKKILFEHTGEKEEMDFRPVGRKYQHLAMKQLTAIYREDTLTINCFMIEQYKPAKFQFRQVRSWNGIDDTETIREAAGSLPGHENELWYRNHTYRLVLSFKKERPRLFSMKDGRIRDVSHITNEDMCMWYWGSKTDDLVDSVLVDELRARFPEMPVHMTQWRAMLDWTRFQFVRDIPVPTKDLYSGFARGDDSIKVVLDKMLKNYARKSTRRGLMEYMKNKGEFIPSRVENHVRKFQEIAPAFDQSEWGDLLSQNVSAIPLDMLEQFSPARRRRLVTETADVRDYRVYDSLRMWFLIQNDDEMEVDISDLANWEDIHRRLTDVTNDAHARRQIAHNEALRKPVPQDKYEEIDGTSIMDGELTIVSPKGAEDLMDWGTELNHCIGSYAIDAVEDRCLFFALNDADGNPVYTAMVNQGNMSQFRGKRNVKVPEDVTEAFVAELKAHKIVRADHPNDESSSYRY